MSAQKEAESSGFASHISITRREGKGGRERERKEKREEGEKKIKESGGGNLACRDGN